MIGACFLPAGLGNIGQYRTPLSINRVLTSGSLHIPQSITVGAPLAGRLSDRIVMRYRASRKGEWVPEDRLRACLWGAALFVPMSVLASGLITHYVGGNLGLGLNLVCLFFNGMGVSICFSASHLCRCHVIGALCILCCVDAGLRTCALSPSLFHDVHFRLVTDMRPGCQSGAECVDEKAFTPAPMMSLLTAC